MRTWLTAGLVVLLTGCITGGYRTTTEYDTVMGRTITRTTKNVIGGFQLRGGNVTINPTVVSDDDGRRYYLSVQWLGGDWIFIDNGESLHLLVDGTRMALSGTVQTQDVGACSGTGCTVDERARYPVTTDQLHAIAAARSATARLQGRRGYVERTFTADNLSVFRQFVAEHVDSSSAPGGPAPE